MSLKGSWVVDHRRMIVTLHTDRLRTLQHVREFLEGNQEVDLVVATRAAAYGFIEQTLGRFDYVPQGKAEKGLLRCFLAKVTGLSRAQLTRLLAQHRVTGSIADRRGAPRRPFPRRYTSIDIGLLAELDRLHGTLSGPATRKLCARAYHRFGDRRFERLAGISNGHLYNLRHSTTYQRRRGTTSTRTRPVQVAIGERRRPRASSVRAYHRFGDRRFERLAGISNGHLYNLRHSTTYQRRRGTTSTRTRPVQVAIGERRRPTPFGRPGYVRVDSVHHADLDDLKGLYHVNLVDEVTQFQFIGSVEHLHAACLAPVLSALLRAFPFTLHGFHSDHGSEYVNRTVAALLEALHIDEFTKSRARHTNDNALVESKNGSVVRKHLGYGHIPSRHAQRVNDFTQNVLSPYLNFHRPCFFPSETVDAKGRRRKRYRDADIMTPYEKLKSLPEAAVYLTPGTTFQQLDAVAFALSDNDAARALHEARARLFRSIDPAA